MLCCLLCCLDECMLCAVGLSRDAAQCRPATAMPADPRNRKKAPQKLIALLQLAR